MKGFIHSFETFGTVDGPGIRFVLFMKGCPLRCKYCHNPDTWTQENAKVFEAEEIKNRIVKYRSYYQNGGVTISGGEPLLQIDFLIELCKLLKQENFHIAIDTSGIVFNENNENFLDKLNELFKYVDLFLLDIKHINNEEHIKLTGKENIEILKFAQYLSLHDKKMWIRHVLVPGITTDEKYLRELKNFIDKLKNVEKVEVLPYHTLGVVKYQKLNIKYPLDGVNPPSKEEVKLANDILKGLI